MSAPDLIAEYYRRDLDAAEEEALAAQLEASPADAARFAQLAADEYRSFGLPEPKGANAHKVPWKGLGAGAAVLLAAGFAYMAWPRHPRPLAIEQVDGAYELRDSGPDAPQPRQARPPAPDADAAAPRLWVSAQSPQGPFDIRVEGAGASRPVGVYSADGSKVAVLREVGQDRYRWDGRVDGRLARPGAYQLRLVSGETRLRQWVEIEVR